MHTRTHMHVCMHAHQSGNAAASLASAASAASAAFAASAASAVLIVFAASVAASAASSSAGGRPRRLTCLGVVDLRRPCFTLKREAVNLTNRKQCAHSGRLRPLVALAEFAPLPIPCSEALPQGSQCSPQWPRKLLHGIELRDDPLNTTLSEDPGESIRSACHARGMLRKRWQAGAVAGARRPTNTNPGVHGGQQRQYQRCHHGAR